MQRSYDAILNEHLDKLSQMVFLAGPRQVGKTTVAKRLLENRQGLYLNWDVLTDRALILSGHQNIMRKHAPPKLGQPLPITVLDEIHKFKDWKDYLKGFYDEYKAHTQIVVIGSSRLDIYSKGGDSLMGRYFPYTVHPFTISELLRLEKPRAAINDPRQLSNKLWQTLWGFGGFPDPFIQADRSFFNQWQNMRHQQLFKEDVIDLSKVSDIAQLEVLASLIKANTGSLINYSSLGKATRSSDQTIRRWFDLLESVYYCFRIRPWYKNVARSLRKEPKAYLWDWSLLIDSGAKTENFIACHLRRSTELWTQLGLGQFDLFYLRDKEKRGVDFLVTRDQQPWFLVEVKQSGSKNLSPSLSRFQQQLGAPHAFQVALDEAFVEENCFAHNTPIIVPAKTFLSQI